MPPATVAHRAAGPRERAWPSALAASFAVFLVYLRTLYPGVVGNRDTAKFQFVGRVLGTPHNPGYPLYVLLTYAFGFLPIRTVAYRINLLSALLGAAAVGMMCVAFRRLGLGRVAAAALAVAAGLGATFWSQAILAEVYMFAACFLAGVLMCLLEWRRTGADRWLFGAIACAAFGLGNHLTIAMVAPAFVAFVLVERPREILRVKVVAWTVALTVAGLLPYLFIIVRTRQGAPYLESSAANLGQLVGVIKANQFQSWLWAYSPADVLRTRLPLMADIFRGEFTIAGLVALAAGVAWCVARDRALAALVVIGVGDIVFFAANYRAPDIEVFLIPAFQCAWLGVAVAGAWLAARGRLWRMGVAVGAAALALVFLRGNWRLNDHSRRVWEGQLLASLSDVVPAHAAIVTEGSGILDWVVDYALYGEGWAAQRGISRVPNDTLFIGGLVTRGRPVFAFSQAHAVLVKAGIEFDAVRLAGPNVFDYLCNQPAGRVVLVAGVPAAWLSSGGSSLRCLGSPPSGARGEEALLAIAGRVGGSSMATTDRGRVTAPGDGAGDKSHAPAARVDGSRAALDLGAAHPDCDGCLLYAILDAGGRVADTGRIDPDDHLRVPFPDASLWRARAAAPCTPIGNLGWTAFTPVAHSRLRLRVDNYRTFVSGVDIVAGGASVAFTSVARVDGPDEATYTVHDRDGLPADAPSAIVDPLRASRSTAWRHLDVADQGQFLILDLDVEGDVSALAVRATVDLPNAARAIVCQVPD